MIYAFSSGKILDVRKLAGVKNMTNIMSVTTSAGCHDSTLKLFHLDGPEKLEVYDGKEGKGNEGHPQEVGDEDVIPCVG